METSNKQKLLLFIGSIIFSFLLGEIAVRILNLAPEVSVIKIGRFRLSKKPKIGYEMMPYMKYEGNNLDMIDYNEKSNSMGFRDYDHSLSNPNNLYRIIVLGDSITQGMGIPDQSNVFTSQIEQNLKASKVNAEVFNFGYNTQQEVEILIEKGLQFKPDLVVLAYCLNDTFMSNGNILYRLLSEEKKKSTISLHKIDSIFLSSALFRAVRYNILQKLLDVQAKDVLKTYESLKKNTVPDYLNKLSDLSKVNGFSVLVAVLPYFKDIYNYQQGKHHKWIKSLSEKNNFFFLDLLPSFQKCNQQTGLPVAFDSYHPTVSGHKCTADSITTAISAIRQQSLN